MKIINEKGKLFGIINPVDLIVVLAVIALVAMVGVKFLRAPVEAVTTQKQEMLVTVRISGARAELADTIKKLEPGTRLVAGNDFVANASVDSVELSNYVFTATDSTGTAVAATDPVKSDILVTIKATGTPDEAIHKIGNQEVRVGTGFIFKTNSVEVNSIVESVIFNG